MKALVTGAGGQLAVELERSLPKEIDVVSLSIEDLDITDREAVIARVSSESPEFLINAAGYTAVDKAEDEESIAMNVNSEGTRHLAEAANISGAEFVYVSTDFVFDGEHTSPYLRNEDPNPLSAYGRSKLAGEVVVREVLGDDALVVRTAWLYSSHGTNFVRAMLRVMKEQGEVRVVDDQIGSPTWARTLAGSIWQLLAVKARGVQHVTDSGCVSWYEFAVGIRDLAVERGLLKDAQVHPISTKDYPTAAQRPAYSVLDIQETFSLLGESAPDWRRNLAICLDEWTTL